MRQPPREARLTEHVPEPVARYFEAALGPNRRRSGGDAERRRASGQRVDLGSVSSGPGDRDRLGVVSSRPALGGHRHRRSSRTGEHRIDADGRLTGSWFLRWGDTDRTGTWQEHPFGVEVTEHQRFGSVEVPSRGEAGWHHGTERWAEVSSSDSS